MNPADLLTYGVLAVVIFLMFRSSQKRKKQAAELQAQLVPGSKVMLHSGIMGSVVSVDDNSIVIESAGSKLEVVRQAVRTVTAADTAEATAEAVAPADETATAPKTPRKRAAKPAAETTEN
jgi:preprotein translocase subunit YajC